jgi:hypothetical protein
MPLSPIENGFVFALRSQLDCENEYFAEHEDSARSNFHIQGPGGAVVPRETPRTRGSCRSLMLGVAALAPAFAGSAGATAALLDFRNVSTRMWWRIPRASGSVGSRCCSGLSQGIILKQVACSALPDLIRCPGNWAPTDAAAATVAMRGHVRSSGRRPRHRHRQGRPTLRLPLVC